MFRFKRLLPAFALAATLTCAVPLHAAPGEKYPQTKTRLLKSSEIAKMSPDARQYAINEIFARHGLLFGDMALRKQFLPFDWYKPEPGQTTDQTRQQFNSYEKRNVERLAKARENADVAAAVYHSPYKTGSQGLAGERYPETRLDELQPADVAAMTDAQLDFAINEVYARHGLVFGDMKLRKHFLGLGWYKPNDYLSDRDTAKSFSKLEARNVATMVKERDLRNQNRRTQ